MGKIKDCYGRCDIEYDDMLKDNNIGTNIDVGKYVCTSTNSTMCKKHDLDAGLDVAAAEKKLIPAGKSAVISTGLHLEIPKGYVGMLWSRSGLSVKHDIEVGAGCIDASYRGEVKVKLYNFGDKDFQVNIGDRIAQLVTLPCNLHLYNKVDSLSDTDRGCNGFGSTGVS